MGDSMNKIEETGKYIAYLSRLISKHTTMKFQKYGLSSIEYMYLMILHDHHELSQNDLSRIAMVDKAQTTRAIQTLLEKGYILKSVHQKDKRKFLISLSKQGVLVAPVIKHEIEMFEEVLNHGITLEEQRLMKKVLIKMIRNLKEVEDNYE